MRIIDGLLAELEQESHATLRVLERVPEDRLAWRPHAKSFSLGQLALHVAQGPGMLTQMAQADSIEMPKFTQTEAANRAELVNTYKQGLALARTELSKMDDARLMQNWSVTRNGQPMMTMPRAGMLRMLLLNHGYHHRGQLTVYLRLLDVSVPSVYGPSADENPFG